MVVAKAPLVWRQEDLNLTLHRNEQFEVHQPGGGHGNPLQSSCLETPTDRGAWRAAVHGVAKESDATGMT